jgi:hypothetical protein
MNGQKLTVMNIDVKHGLITVAAVIVGCFLYDRFVAPMADKAID